MPKLRFLCTICLLFLIKITAAQDSNHVAVQYIKVNKLNYQQAEITIGYSIAPGWLVYQKNPGLDLWGPVLKNKNPDRLNISEVLFTTKPIEKEDLIFQQKLPVFTDSLQAKIVVKATDSLPSAEIFQFNYDVALADNFQSEEQEITVQFTDGDVPTLNQKDNKRLLIKSIDIQNPITKCGELSASGASDTESKGLLSLFFLGFLGGLLALITPCVFPMIPLTVSFFTKKSKSRKQGIINAFLYGFFIWLIYVLLSLPFHFLDIKNPEILNNISTNVYLNVGFFIVFIVFALSFFGLFEITLPSNLSNKMDSKSGTKNIIGIFFMAITLALVSFSCTGPILGSLLAGSLSSDGGAMQLTAGMAGFGLALGLPFALFALFPHWLNSLPKSGGWLTSVKIVLGFVELALALKFLSNADLVMHWGILKREIFIGIWIIIGLLLSLYLWGIVKFPHDTLPKKLPRIRILAAVLASAFTIYLVPGVTNTKYANLSLISGFAPPMYYSIYARENKCVLNLNCTNDYEQGLQMAREQNKPILLDFTGYACVNCRRMEENVWVQPDIYKVMKDNYIIISLYVDDKEALPVEDQFTYVTKQGLSKKIKTVGDKWSTFETENFANNSQPWYAIINSKEQLLTYPLGYANTKKLEREYLSWLLCGVDAAKKTR